MVSSWSFIGNSRAIEYLRLVAQSPAPAQAYLLTGPSRVGKTTAALLLARALLCSAAAENRPCGECSACRAVALNTHSDFYQLELLPDKTQISIEQVQELNQKLILNSSHGGRKVALIRGADHLNAESANCLLKTLEEPHGETTFILVAADHQKLLPTIISRCQLVRFFPVGRQALVAWLLEKHGLTNHDLAHELAAISGGRPGQLLALLDSLEEHDGYTRKIQSWAEILPQNLAAKFKFSADLFPKSKFVNSQAIARESLEILTALSRDLFLVKMKADNLINYHFLLPQLETMASTITWPRIYSLINRLRLAHRRLLTTNTNPRLVIENLLLAI